LNHGYGSVAVTMPAGGSATGTKIGLHTFATTLNVRDFGAQGDGVTDDTAAIQAALDVLTTAHGGTAYFPQGTYLVRPTVSGDPILLLGTANLRLTGEGVGQATIKVGNGSLPYKSILHGTIVNTDLSNLQVDHLTFDHNIANNALASEASILAHPQMTVAVFNGTDIRYTHLHIINASSTNNLVANGTAVARVTITHCIFSNIGDDPNHIKHDASLIYTDGPQVVIAHNQFVSAGQDSGGAVTAIETHSSSCVIADNVIVDFLIGMNVTGVTATDTHDIAVTGNTMSGGCFGIQLWSMSNGAHTSGYGLNGVTVIGNVINLVSQASWPTRNPFGGEAGIAFALPAVNLPANAIIIAHNVVRFPLETVALDHNVVSVGIGWVTFEATPPVLSNSAITHNTIVNFPLCGLRFSCALEHVDISSNTLVNCGSAVTASYADTTAFRIPLFLSALTITGLTIRHNTFIDSLAQVTHRPAYFIYLFQTGATVATGVEILDNTFVSTGSAMTQQIFLDLAGGLLQPLLRGAIANFVPTTGANQKWKKGSRVLDPTTGIAYLIGTDQFTWTDGLLQAGFTPVRATRFATFGTLIVAADVALTGWGAGAVVVVNGTDQCPIIQITCGTAPTLNPQFVFTFRDGAWPGANPLCLVQLASGSGITPVAVPLSFAVTSTQLTVFYTGTPTAGLVYQFQALVFGRF